VRERLISNISHSGAQDGMDAVLLCIENGPVSKKITYAAANNAPVVIHNGAALVLPSDKMPVGKGEKNNSFNLFDIKPAAGDTVYLFTDGYADQFGGPKGKKFMYKQLNELLVTMNVVAMEKRPGVLKERLEQWKSELEQVDDICIMGIQL
jgi:serine phosphatase RsbU (regulator of sigma subunit)